MIFCFCAMKYSAAKVQLFLQSATKNSSPHALKQEADRAEAVVAADHGRVGVLHPAVVEVAAAGRQLLDKPAHALPRAVAHPFGHRAATAHPFLPNNHIAGMCYRVFEFRLQVLVVRLAHNCNFHIVHRILCFAVAKVQLFSRWGNIFFCTSKKNLTFAVKRDIIILSTTG